MAFSTGDRVQWNTPQGPTQGTVRSTHTDEFEFKGQTFKATDDDPVHEVESEKTGSRAAHHASALEAAPED